MLAHQKLFLMLHNNFVKKKKKKKNRKKNIGDSISWCCYRQSCVLTITPPQREYWKGRINHWTCKWYKSNLRYYNYSSGIYFTKELNEIHLSNNFFLIIIKIKGLLKNRKFRCVVYMSNELISKIIWLSFWLLVLFSVLFVNCGDNIKVYFSIVTHEIPLRVIKKKHVGLDAQSGRQ